MPNNVRGIRNRHGFAPEPVDEGFRQSLGFPEPYYTPPGFGSRRHGLLLSPDTRSAAAGRKQGHEGTMRQKQKRKQRADEHRRDSRHCTYSMYVTDGA